MAFVTSTYARAFVDVILDKKLDASRTLRELRALGDLVAGNSDLRRVWENPAIPAAKKRDVLDAIVAREAISPPVRNFVAVLMDHRRIPFLLQIISAFEQELNQRLGIAEAEVTTARDLDDAEKRSLEAQVQKLTGKKVKASYSRDRSILGGAVIKVGSTIYDGSVLGQLHEIRKQLARST